MRKRCLTSLFLLCVLAPASRALAADGTVRLRSRPSRAQVIVDGKAQGATPCELTLPAGSHSLTLKLKGHTPETTDVQVRPGRTTKLYILLSAAGTGGVKVHRGGEKKPAPGMGMVTVDTRPPGLTVHMNAEEVEDPTPVSFDIAPGSYVLVINDHGTEVMRKKVQVTAGKKLRLRPNLTKAVHAARQAGATTTGRCRCKSPRTVRRCVEKRRQCRYHPDPTGATAGYADCTRCRKYRRLRGRRRARAKEACDSRAGRAGGCVCRDLRRVVSRCLAPQDACLQRCGGGR